MTPTLTPATRPSNAHGFGSMSVHIGELAIVIGALLFPLLPRVRDPLVSGRLALPGSSTALSDSINFNESRTSDPDPAVVARVWMGQEAIPFFTPLRLRGAVYDSYSDNRWLQTAGSLKGIAARREEDAAGEQAQDAGLQREPDKLRAQIVSQASSPEDAAPGVA